MFDMTVNNFFDEEDDGDFFAEAIRSISKIESSSKLVPQSSKCFTDTNLNIDCNKTSGNESNSGSIRSKEKNCISTHSSRVSFGINEKIAISQKNCEEYNINTEESKYITDNIISNVTAIKDKNSLINHRFTPGFTPKAKKRKFPGPAGCFIEEPTQIIPDNEPVLKKFSISEPENISSSQFSVRELLQSLSWQKLQEEVSSHSGLLSIAKNFSIQRVLDDTSKKKLPKHIVVPVLCLFIKKFNPEESTSVYLDDTGEINGKVEEEVLNTYKECMECGTALILRNVTFICNVMLLKNSNLVTIYHNNGTVQQVISWDEIVAKGPLNPLNCIRPITPKLAKRQSIPNTVKTDLVISAKSPLLQIKQNINSNHSLFHKTKDLNHNSSFSRPDDVSMKNLQNLPISDDNILENDAMDDFDELLGNLDEKSFLDDF